VTTLNFNLMFELGFCVGLGLPVIPIRDTTYNIHQRDFDEIGILDTLGYMDFRNSQELVAGLIKRLPHSAPLPELQSHQFRETPLYVLKGRVESEGAVQMMSNVKKSSLRFRTYDPLETPRLSLHEARRQVSGSIGVLCHLSSPHRKGSSSQNGLAAFISGLALSLAKVVVMLQEDRVSQPIDYRDIVLEYSAPSEVPRLLERPLREVIGKLQDIDDKTQVRPERLLERLDLGDTAAENEIGGLKHYFVPTGPFRQAQRGHVRLVVGRKGTGKTALFYGLRNSLRGRQRLLLDLKPEGHQFKKLKETVLSGRSEGVQEHTLTAFWTYILLCELARRILELDVEYHKRDENRFIRYGRLREVFTPHALDQGADFSQRLLHQVSRIADAAQTAGAPTLGSEVTQLIFQGDIRELSQCIGEYLSERDETWILIDNLDKGWPTKGTTEQDTLILRSLLESMQKLQRELETNDATLRCLVFVRTDLYDHLLRETPDRGKDTAVRLDWDDPEVFKEIFLQRVRASLTNASISSFNDAWACVFSSHVGTQDSFAYLLERTLMRPRDFLSFVQRCTEVAVNRRHPRVTEEDILQAERSYSEDMLLQTAFEIEDAYPELADVLYQFQGTNEWLEPLELETTLKSGSGNSLGSNVEKTVDLLLWYGFLGVVDERGDEVYSYSVRHNTQHLRGLLRLSSAHYSIHPAFRAALRI